MKKLALILLPLVGCGGNDLKSEITNLQNHIVSTKISLNEAKTEASICSRDKESLRAKLSAADANIAKLSEENTKLRANQKILLEQQKSKSSYRSQQQDLRKHVTGGSGSK